MASQGGSGSKRVLRTPTEADIKIHRDLFTELDNHAGCMKKLLVRAKGVVQEDCRVVDPEIATRWVALIDIHFRGLTDLKKEATEELDRWVVNSEPMDTETYYSKRPKISTPAPTLGLLSVNTPVPTHFPPFGTAPVPPFGAPASAQFFGAPAPGGWGASGPGGRR
jgi:hypothetical protein